MVGRVYLETTIPSAYASTRTDPSSVHRRELTRAWWGDQGPRYDLWISEAGRRETGPAKPSPSNWSNRCDRFPSRRKSWNIRHLANPNKMAHLTVINRRLGLLTPQVVTPEMLWLEDEG